MAKSYYMNEYFNDTTSRKMKLSDAVVSTFKTSKIFRDHHDEITSLDMSLDGKRLVSSGTDHKIITYDCEKGTKLNTVHTSVYGVGLTRFTHAPSAVLHTSTKHNDSIRYLSLFDNQYLRYFAGHSECVISLSMSPLSDAFISTSLDNSLRLWDLRTPYAEARLVNVRRPVATFDRNGLNFAVAIDSELVRLYDVRAYTKGPHTSFKFRADLSCNWTDLKYSPNGDYLLVSTNGTVMRLLDAKHGSPLQTFDRFVNDTRVALQPDFSPDSEYVFCGGTDGRVHAWNCDNGYMVCTYNPGHVAPVRCVAFNPRLMMFASAGVSLAFWLPTFEADRHRVAEKPAEPWNSYKQSRYTPYSNRYSQ